MIRIVKVIGVEALGDYRLRVAFSDGAAGAHDFTDMVAESGPMIEPLRDPKVFSRVFVSMGVLTWPNGFDIDAVHLRDEMQAAGAFGRVAAE